MLNGDCCSDYYDVCMWIYEDKLDEPREVLIDTSKPNQLLMLAMSHVGLYKYGLGWTKHMWQDREYFKF